MMMGMGTPRSQSRMARIEVSSSQEGVAALIGAVECASRVPGRAEDVGPLSTARDGADGADGARPRGAGAAGGFRGDRGC